MAQACGIARSPHELDGLTEPLRALESRFRPLAAELEYDCDPATIFRAAILYVTQGPTE